MTRYDTWLESPYHGRIIGEDFIGRRVVVDGAWGTITEGHEWSDEDEDGRYGGVDFTVKIDDYYGGGESTITEPEAEEQLQLKDKFAKARARRHQAWREKGKS